MGLPHTLLQGTLQVQAALALMTLQLQRSSDLYLSLKYLQNQMESYEALTIIYNVLSSCVEPLLIKIMRRPTTVPDCELASGT